MKNKNIIVLTIVIIFVLIGTIFTIMYLKNKPNTEEEDTSYYYAYEVNKVLENKVITSYEEYSEIANTLGIQNDMCESKFANKNVLMYFINTDTCGKSIYDLVTDAIGYCDDRDVDLYIKDSCCTGNEKDYVIMILSPKDKEDINDIKINKHRLYNSCKKES